MVHGPGHRTITSPTLIPRSAHCISRADISDSALKVLYRLSKAGYDAYLVGGGVRDLLLGLEPKDFDLVTDARPEEIRSLFRNCRLIGRRFRLAHVRFGREIIEVATYRALAGEADAGAADDRVSVNGRILRDNVYGSFEEDAWRRDFTVNCLYYNIKDFSVVDFTGGMADLEARTLRLIGDPEVRLREDPVRILRALRLAAKLDFRIHPGTETPMGPLTPLLEDIPPARLFEEVVKMFLSGHALRSLEQLMDYRVFGYLFPATRRALERDGGGSGRRLVERALANTDQRLAEDRPVTPGFLFAALLWPALREAAQALEAEGMTTIQAIDRAGADVVGEQIRRVSLPKRFAGVARDIWSLQPRLASRRGRRPFRLVEHERFRAAYDFLLLRAEAGEGDDVAGLARWWTEFIASDPGARQTSLETVAAGEHPGRERRPRSRRRRRRRRAVS